MAAAAMITDVATTLFYSDDPETLGLAAARNGEGVLFSFDLVNNDVVRFLFYHWLKDGASRVIALRALNRSPGPTTFKWRGCVPSPSNAIMNAGHHCTSGFLKTLCADNWATVDLNEGGAAVVVSGAMDAGDLFNGIIEFQLCGAASVRLSLVVANSADRVTLVESIGATLAPDGRGRSGKFDISDKTPFNLTYDGTASASVRLGERTHSNLRSSANGVVGEPLKGEYAVASHVHATLTNPTAQDQTFGLYQAAHGGDSTASYAFPDQFLESGTMNAKAPPLRYKLRTWAIGAGTSVEVDLWSIPDNASSSPVVLTVDLDDGSAAPGAPTSIVQIDPGSSPTSLIT